MTQYIVFGHQNPDTDTISSAIAMSDYLTQLGHEAEPVALGAPNDETLYALEHFGFKAPRIVKEVAGQSEAVALVDHNEPGQSAPDIDQVRIDYVVDHHRISGFESAQPLYFRTEPIGCTATLLYKMYQEQGFEIAKDLAGLMLSAIISDSLLFKSPTCTQEDIDVAHKLAAIAEVDLEEYGLSMLRAGTDLTKRTPEEILNGDAKNFVMGGKNVRIGQVNVVAVEDFLPLRDSVLKAMHKEKEANDYDTVLLVVTDILENDSLGLVVGDSQAIVESAFDQEIKDAMLNLPNIVSRKSQVVPPLTEAFES